MFAGGQPPARRDLGRLEGDFLAFTVAPGADRALLAAHRRVRPWLGKDIEVSRGENRLSPMAARLARLAFRRAARPVGDGEGRGFPFAAAVAPSLVVPGLPVLRIDYDVPENPRPVRRILDELVELPSGVILGHGLVRARGVRRFCWFCLWEPAAPAEAD
jgi:hypothetical protein